MLSPREKKAFVLLDGISETTVRKKVSMSAFILSDDGKLTHAPQYAGSEGVSLGDNIPVGAR